MSNKIIIELESKDSATGNITASVRGIESSLQGLEATGNSVFGSLDSSITASIASLGKWAAAIAAASAAFAAMAFTKGIAAIDEFNQKTIGIAATLTNMAKEGQGSFKEMFDRNLSHAKKMYEELRKVDAERFSSLDDMMATYNILVQKGYAARVEEAKYIGIITDKIKMATQGQDASVQINQEIRALMDGQARAGSQLAQELQTKLGPGWADIVEKHREAGTLLQYLAGLWPGIEAATEHTQQTLESQKSTLEGNLKYVGREGLAGAYTDIVNLLAHINDYLRLHGDELAEKISRGWVSIAGSIRNVYDTLKMLPSLGLSEFFQRSLEEVRLLTTELKIAAQLLKLDFSGAAETRRQYRASNYRAGGSLVGYGSEGEGHVTGAEAAGQTAAKNMKAAVDLGTQEGIKKAIEDAAKRHGIPSDILLAVAQQESGFKQTAVSPKGAIGIMQLMPKTAAGMGINPLDPAQNIEGGARYLKEQFNTFKDWSLALAAYNAGPGNVEKYGGIPPFKETQNYVYSILGKGRGAAESLKGFGSADREAEQAAKKWESFQERERKKSYNDMLKDSQDTAKLAEKLRSDNMAGYLEMVNYRKQLDTDAQKWTTDTFESVMQDESKSYKERAAAGEQYKNLRLTQINQEIEALRQKYGGRISEESLESFRTVQVDHVNQQIAQATSPQIIHWESAWKRASENIQDTMADMIMNLFDRSKTASEMLQSLVKGMLQILAQTAAQSIMGAAQSFVGGMFGGGSGAASGIGGFFAGLGGKFGGMFGLGSSSAAAGAATSWTTGGAAIATDMAAWTPSYATFAEGGISASPQLAWVSETGPEAHVPLKGGAIPVKLSGGGGNYHISVSHSPNYNYRPDKSDYERDAKMIVQALDKELRGYTKRTARNFVKI